MSDFMSECAEELCSQMNEIAEIVTGNRSATFETIKLKLRESQNENISRVPESCGLGLTPKTTHINWGSTYWFKTWGSR